MFCWLQISKLNQQGKTSDLLYTLSQGPDHRARVFNRCFINGFLFRTEKIEQNLCTQNSGVVVKGDESSGNIDWYGVIKKIIALDFPQGKEVFLFQCNWFHVPTAKNKGRGYQRDQYGIIDIDKTRLCYLDEPYILGSQAEQVFYVNGTKKKDWCTVVRMKPRNLFAMPESENSEIDLDSLHVGFEGMSVSSSDEVLVKWRRSDMEGVIGDACVIEKALAEFVEESHDIGLADEEDEEDNTYIDDGYVAPVDSSRDANDDDFFV